MDIIKERLDELIYHIEQINACHLDTVDDSEINKFKNATAYTYRRCPYCSTIALKGLNCIYCRQKNDTVTFSYEILQKAKQNYAKYYNMDMQNVCDEQVIKSSAGVLGWYNY